MLRALGYAEQAVILSMGQDDLEACAATLLLVSAEAGRAGLDDVAGPANDGAAEIYRLLERDDLAQVLSGEHSPLPAARAPKREPTRLEAGLEAARSVVNPHAGGRPQPERPLSRPGRPGGGITRPLSGAAVPLGGDDMTRLLLVGS